MNTEIPQPSKTETPKPQEFHYANGRKAGHREPVLFRDQSGQVQIGRTGQLNPQQRTENVTLSIHTSGGLGCDTIPISQCWHAEDAFAALQPKP